MWKFTLIILISLFWGTSVYSQVFTQTYYDRCTGELKVVTANFFNNQNTTTISFYNRVRTFTITEVLDGTLLKWMDETYAWWYTLSPCSTQTQQTQNTQVNLSNISNTVSNIPSNNNQNTITNTTDTNKSNNDSNSSSEEQQESGSNDEESEDKENEKTPSPIMVSGDVILMQNLNNSFNSVISTGISKSSLYGDASYNANILLWDNLNQFSLSTSYSKSFFSEDYDIEFIENYNVSYIYSYGVNSINLTYNKIIPKNIGIFGYGFNKSIIFGKNIDNYIYNITYNLLYTNTLKINRNLMYSPAIIISSSPISYINNFNTNIISKDAIFVCSNGFDYRITKRFKFNVNYTIITSTNVNFPVLNNIIIGSKIVL